jgi:hypothetical protein
MSGPAPQDRKHGRTPNSTTNGDWREYEDVPFEGAPPMPKPRGRRRAWHPYAEDLWNAASVMPHCVDWRAEDWLTLRILVGEVDQYYNMADAKRKTAQMTEIRRQMNELGIGDKARIALRIRYKQKVEPGLAGLGPAGAREVIDGGTQPAGKVVPLRDRKRSITGRGEKQAGTATG